MSDFLQKTWHTTEEVLRQLDEVGERVGVMNRSATIRYCIKKAYEELFPVREGGAA